MLHSLISLLPLAVEAEEAGRADRRGRSRRGGRSRRPRLPQEELGKWIWTQEGRGPNSHIYARKLFKLAKKPDSAIIKATADSAYKLYVNGEYVGKGPARSGSGYSYYDTFDLTGLLSKGNNVIAFHVHHIGDSTYSYILGRPGLICKCEIEVGEETEVIETDESWIVHAASDFTDKGARLSKRLGFQELYDAEQALAGWNEVKFKEKGWEAATVVGTAPSQPWGPLVERMIPQLREEKLLPQAITGTFNSPDRSAESAVADLPWQMSTTELSPPTVGNIKNPANLLADDGLTHIKTPKGDGGVVLILDFGREVFGNVEVGIAGSGSGCIDLGYGELLQEGRVKPNRGEMRYADRVLLKKGRLDWQSFEPRAFRYMQIEFRRCSKTVALEYVRVNQTTYPVERVGAFECSDPLLNEIWQVGAYTTQLCMQDAFIDSPWRSQAQKWADARVESRIAYYAFGDTKLLAQGLRQFADAQRRDGSMAGSCPSGDEKVVPDFSLFWLFSILDYFAFSDDEVLVKDLYPNVRSLMNWFGEHVHDDGLLGSVPGRLFIDWADLDKRGDVTALNCLYHHALRVCGVIAAIIGHLNESDDFMDAATALKVAINKYLYSPKKGLYAECRVDGKLVEKYSRQTNILAALFEVADQYQRASIFRQVLSGPMPDLGTPYFVSHLLEALYLGEKHTEALEVIRSKWGQMLKGGATTFWETFTPEWSLCNGWSACPTRDLMAEYVGIKPVLGAHRFTIAPHVADLRWARGTVGTNTGPLTVDWKATRDYLTISVDVPPGLKVDVYPPCAPTSKVSLDGKALPTRFVTIGEGAHVIKVTAARLEKPAEADASLAPPSIPHVEVLGELLLRRRVREGGERGRGRRSEGRPRRGKGAEGLGEMREPTPSEQDEPLEEIIFVDESGEEVIVEAVETVETVEAAEEAPKEARKRSRRGGRGRSRSRENETAEGTAEPPKEAPEAAVEEPAPVAEAAEPAGEAQPRSSRRRSRRGGRGRGRSREREAAEAGTGEQGPAEQPAEPIVTEPQPEAAIAESTEGAEQAAPRKRSRRGGRGRGRSRSREAAEGPNGAVEEAAPPVEPVAEIIETAQPEGSDQEQPRKRTRRGGRGRSSRGRAQESPEAQAEGVPQVIEQAPPVISEPVPESQPVEAAEAPKKPRRSPRPKPAKAEESAGEAPPEAPVVEAPPAPAAEPVADAEKKPRARRAAPRKRVSKPKETEGEQAPGE